MRWAGGDRKYRVNTLYKTDSLTVGLMAASRGKEACHIGFKMKVN